MIMIENNLFHYRVFSFEVSSTVHTGILHSDKFRMDERAKLHDTGLETQVGWKIKEEESRKTEESRRPVFNYCWQSETKSSGPAMSASSSWNLISISILSTVVLDTQLLYCKMGRKF